MAKKITPKKKKPVQNEASSKAKPANKAKAAKKTKLSSKDECLSEAQFQAFISALTRIASSLERIAEGIVPKGPAAAVAKAVKTSRDVVYDCLGRQPGNPPDSAKLSEVPADPDNLGACINDTAPLKGNKRFRAGQLLSSHTIAEVISKTDARR